MRESAGPILTNVDSFGDHLEIILTTYAIRKIPTDPAMETVDMIWQLGPTHRVKQST